MSAPMHQAHAAVVWLDHWHALVARHEAGSATIVDVTRGREPVSEFLARVSRLTVDCERLMILGPGDERLARGRELVGHLTGRVIALDIEASASATPAELFDRLRLLDGDGAAPD
jgi:hypothetical protein